MKIPFSYIFRNMWTRKLTTLLTMSGVGLVVFAFAAVLMLAYGIQKTLVATGRDDNLLLLRKSATTEIISTVTRDDVSIVKNFPEVASTPDGKPFTSSEVSVIINLLKIGSNNMGNVIVRGIEPEGVALRPQVKFVKGQMFKLGSSEIVIGNSIHKIFQGCDIGQRIKFGAREWTIVGVFDAEGSGFDSEIWGDVNQFLPAFGRPVFSAMTFRIKDKSDFNAVKTRLEADPRLQQLEVQKEKVFYEEQSKMMSAFIQVIGLVITIIFSFGAMIGAMITMYAAVANRTVEIGTLRALGFQRLSVLFAFLVEAVFISIVGGGIGLVLSSFLQFITISTTNFGSFSELAFSFAVSPWIIISSLVFALVMGLFGGFLPAVRASRLPIVNALRAA